LNLLAYQRFANRAKLARFTAERGGAPTVSFDADLMMAAESAPHLLDLLTSETGGFEARRKALETQASLYDERIHKGNEQLERLRQQLRSLDRQRLIVERQSKDAQTLLDKGFGTRSRAAELHLDSERLLSRRLEVEAEMDDLLGVVEDARLNKERLLAERAQEIEQELSDTQRRLAELDVQIRAVQNRLDGLKITSPVRGVVVDLKVTSINDVIKPAAPILDILPTDSAYLVEAQIPPHQIEGVAEGMDVEVRFRALSGKRVPTVMGKVAMVSADIVSDPGQDHRFYRVHVSLADLQDIEREIGIMPGMPTEVILKKRDRTLLEYLIAPLTDHLARSVV
jgi:HlyD family type I secretion membrane fusion protein